METFTTLRGFIDDPGFKERRSRSSSRLDLGTIDEPVRDIIGGFAKIPYCFTLQSCYGHFLYPGQSDPHHVGPLPALSDDVEVEYRIAYIALCMEDGSSGRALFEDMGRTPVIDPDYIQFGCSPWFWERQPNSFALQVEPDRYKCSDTATVAYREALRIEATRGLFFAELRRILGRHLEEMGSA